MLKKFKIKKSQKDTRSRCGPLFHGLFSQKLGRDGAYAHTDDDVIAIEVVLPSNLASWLGRAG